MGPNGSGKTAIPEAFILLRDTLDYIRGRVVNPFQRWWGYRNVAWRHDEKLPVEIGVELDCSACSVEELAEYLEALGVDVYGSWLEIVTKSIRSRGLRYSLVVSGAGGGFHVLREKLVIPDTCEYSVEPRAAHLKLGEHLVQSAAMNVKDFASTVALRASLETSMPHEYTERMVVECVERETEAVRK